ncbi:MAG: fibronectin type III domain-containing protein [Planctomycetes bacterium]|nr:fibronectin type III domain-containing protein [Planctomycetota bacterium]
MEHLTPHVPAWRRASCRKLLAALCGLPLIAQTPQERAVPVTVTVDAWTPAISLAWPFNVNAQDYTVARRVEGATAFEPTIIVPGGGTATGWTDTAVTAGQRYEYHVVRRHPTDFFLQGYTLLSAGIEASLTDQRGKLVLLVDQRMAAPLAKRFDRFISDLQGDGWSVIRHDVGPYDPVTSVKALIVAAYLADPANVKAVVLLGRIPVPYSGNLAPDGHSDHIGAWPADVYYGEMDGVWTDSSVNNPNASRPQNRNIPGDGKFDQSTIPGQVELMVGRIDFSQFTAFGMSEEQHLVRYLDKNHDWRHKRFTAAPRAVIDDNFGFVNGEAFAASGWRNFGSLLGPSNVTEADYFTTLNTTSGSGYLWSYGCGGGWYSGATGIGTTQDFVTSTNRSVFTVLFGSYFGDWDSEDNFLRAPLGSGWTLASFWAGRPHWGFYQMGMGAPIGSGALATQNEGVNGGLFARLIHIALMGDPTLRMHIVEPPSQVQVIPTRSGHEVHWAAPREAVDGYHVYRAQSTNGPWTRITTVPITGTRFIPALSPGVLPLYMVRSIKLTTTPTGSYWNSSQGILASSPIRR